MKMIVFYYYLSYLVIVTPIGILRTYLNMYSYKTMVTIDMQLNRPNFCFRIRTYFSLRVKETIISSYSDGSLC